MCFIALINGFVLRFVEYFNLFCDLITLWGVFFVVVALLALLEGFERWLSFLAVLGLGLFDLALALAAMRLCLFDLAVILEAK